jgi:hypothetical protein
VGKRKMSEEEFFKGLFSKLNFEIVYISYYSDGFTMEVRRSPFEVLIQVIKGAITIFRIIYKTDDSRIEFLVDTKTIGIIATFKRPKGSLIIGRECEYEITLENFEEILNQFMKEPIQFVKQIFMMLW